MSITVKTQNNEFLIAGLAVYYVVKEENKWQIRVVPLSFFEDKSIRRMNYPYGLLVADADTKEEIMNKLTKMAKAMNAIIM